MQIGCHAVYYTGINIKQYVLILRQNFINVIISRYVLLPSVQWLSQNLRMPLAPGGVSPLHRTGNALKVFCVAIQTPQLWTVSYPRWQKFYWSYAFLSIPQRVTSYPSYPSYTDIILTLFILLSTWCVLSSF